MKALFLKQPVPIILVLIVTLLFGSYLYATAKKKVLDDEARKSAPGRFIKLSKGVIHFEITGRQKSQAVVLINGFATPYFIWDNNYDELVNAGFRVLRYDHCGRGFSDRPDVVYNKDLYDQLLIELLQKLKIKLPVHLVGLSMGGAIAVTFADRHPEMVSKICLIAPAGFPFKKPLTLKLTLTPIIGDYIMTMAGDQVVLAGIKKAFVHPGKLLGFEDKFKVQMKYRDFKRALLSTMRYMYMNSLGETYQRVGKQENPVLLIWGSKDQILPFTNSKKVKKVMPHVELHAIEGAGHNLHYENPEIINPIIHKFLMRRQANKR